jgi:predicted RNA-binding Zn-ribbon protein involved in translation (DUF1610 family)
MPPPAGTAEQSAFDDANRPGAPAPAETATTAPATAAHDAEQFPCKQCGAALSYQPGTTTLVCPYCGTSNEIALTPTDLRKLDFRAYAERLAAEAETDERTTVRCDACGAEVDRPPNLDAFACPFCGSNIVATAVSRRLIKPRAMLPFGIERPAAEAHYRHWLRSLWFAPNALRDFARLQARLSGVYVPYWMFDARTQSWYTGERGEHYWVTVGSGKNRRTVRQTRWYPASGVVSNAFRNLLVLGSRSLPRRYADALEPWDLAQLVPYDPAYLSGFLAESYTLDLVGGFTVAQQVMAPAIQQTVRSDIGGDEQRIYSLDTQYHEIGFQHVLLPIWISAYQFKGRSYRFLVNGRTGEVQGERPWSWIKITLAVLAALVAAAAVAWMFAQHAAR